MALLQMEVSGRKVQKVPVHIEELSAWCRNRGRPLDAAARAEYVSERLREQER